MAADASEGGEGTWAELRKGIEWERRTIQRTVLGPLNRSLLLCLHRSSG